MSEKKKIRFLKKVVLLYLAMCVIVTGIWGFVTLRTLVLDAVALGEICAMWCAEGVLSYLIEKKGKKPKEETTI